MTSRTRNILIAIIVIAAALTLHVIATAAPIQEPTHSIGIWRDIAEKSIGLSGARWIVPDRYRVVEMNMKALADVLATAPLEFTSAAQRTSVVLELPLPNGSTGRFRIEDSPIMQPGLAAKFPDIKTYRGQGLDDPTATMRFDVTQFGFHAQILSSAGTIYIDPYQRSDTQHYIVYDKRDYHKPGAENWTCGFEQVNEAAASLDLEHLNLPHAPSGSVLRIYRLAVAATGEYTQFHGGTVNAGMAAIVTSVNRVDGVYEREVAVRMVLVNNNNLIVYTDGTTDPYTNNNGVTMLGQNQTNLDNMIGSANYDIGHVFSTGGGGIASLGVPCTASKARGVTGSPQPIGDGFDIDYVAHEMGHQFGARHTFNGTTGNCGGGNRSASAAYEPGSGSTIMAYAGICGAEDLQPHSDDYFHVKSFDEIVAFTTLGAGNSCPVTMTTGNAAPSVTAGSSYMIPAQTPFVLNGSATDPNGDPLTYDWEQFDLGAAAPPNTDDGTRPIFRSFNPVTSTARTFPKLTDILNNTTTFGESLPTTTRNLTFRLTARDNRSGGGGVDYSSVVLNVTNAAGPFLVTVPNTATTWTAFSTQPVMWNVANTNAAPVNCANVDILLSLDGGYTFPITLTAVTPNDGAESIVVPNAPTTKARVKVQCSDNIFFDISNVNGTIVPAFQNFLPIVLN